MAIAVLDRIHFEISHHLYNMSPENGYTVDRCPVYRDFEMFGIKFSFKYGLTDEGFHCSIDFIDRSDRKIDMDFAFGVDRLKDRNEMWRRYCVVRDALKKEIENVGWTSVECEDKFDMRMSDNVRESEKVYFGKKPFSVHNPFMCSITYGLPFVFPKIKGDSDDWLTIVNISFNQEYRYDDCSDVQFLCKYAIDQNGDLVSIKDAVPEEDYFCPACRKRLDVVVGEGYRGSYFSHEQGKLCWNYIDKTVLLMYLNELQECKTLGIPEYKKGKEFIDSCDGYFKIGLDPCVMEFEKFDICKKDGIPSMIRCTRSDGVELFFRPFHKRMMNELETDLVESYNMNCMVQRVGFYFPSKNTLESTSSHDFCVNDGKYLIHYPYGDECSNKIYDDTIKRFSEKYRFVTVTECSLCEGHRRDRIENEGEEPFKDLIEKYRDKFLDGKIDDRFAFAFECKTYLEFLCNEKIQIFNERIGFYERIKKSQPYTYYFFYEMKKLLEKYTLRRCPHYAGGLREYYVKENKITFCRLK